MGSENASVKTLAAAFQAALAAIALAPKFVSKPVVNVGVIITSTLPERRQRTLPTAIRVRWPASVVFAGREPAAGAEPLLQSSERAVLDARKERHTLVP